MLPTDIADLEMLRNNFRTMNIVENQMIHEDLLQLDVMLWYAWQSTFWAEYYILVHHICQIY